MTLSRGGREAVVKRKAGCRSSEVNASLLVTAAMIIRVGQGKCCVFNLPQFAHNSFFKNPYGQCEVVCITANGFTNYISNAPSIGSCISALFHQFPTKPWTARDKVGPKFIGEDDCGSTSR